MNERKFKVKAPLGSLVASKEVMTESEVREFALQLINDSEEREIWKQKVEKDPIEDVLNWVNITDFTITEL
jgi:hypothetical protein